MPDERVDKVTNFSIVEIHIPEIWAHRIEKYFKGDYERMSREVLEWFEETLSYDDDLKMRECCTCGERFSPADKGATSLGQYDEWNGDDEPACSHECALSFMIEAAADAKEDKAQMRAWHHACVPRTIFEPRRES